MCFECKSMNYQEVGSTHVADSICMNALIASDNLNLAF